MTIQQAIDLGYTHAGYEGAEGAIKLTKMLNEPDVYNNEEKYFLCEKEPYAFSIDADTMSDLVQRHIEEQEEVYDYSEKIFDEAAQADYEKIAELINVHFKPRFYGLTDIQLEINHQQ